MATLSRRSSSEKFQSTATARLIFNFALMIIFLLIGRSAGGALPDPILASPSFQSPSVDLSITMTASASMATTGLPFTYTITVTNRDPSFSAPSVRVIDNLPDSTTFVSCSTTGGGACSGSANTRVVTFSSLGSGESATIALVVDVNCSVAGGATISNTATVNFAGPDPNPGNNMAAVVMRVFNQPPAIACPADIVVTAPPGQATAVVNYPPATVSDTCPGTTVVFSPPSGSTFPIGVTKVTSTATDSGGATSSCTFTVTVVDNQPPKIICPDNIVVKADPGKASAVVNYPPPKVSDNSPGITIVSTPPSGSTFPIGVTTVTCTATDRSGNRATCTFTITVIDDQPPIITCPADIVKVAAPGQCSAVVDYPAPKVSDNAPGVTVVSTPPSGSTFPVGTTTVTSTATDTSGNKAACSFTVRVIETQPPTIVCPANIVTTAASGQCSAIVNYPPVNVSDNCSQPTVVYSMPSGSTFPVGTTTVTCTATDTSGNKAACNFTVTVNGPPQAKLTLEGDKDALEFGPVPARRKPKANPPFGRFKIENTGCASLGMVFVSLMRQGNDIDNGRIVDPNESGLFFLRVVNGDGTESPLDMGTAITVLAGEEMNFRILFNPVIPAVAEQTQGLSADQVLPDLITSRLTIVQNAGDPLVVYLIGHIATAVKLINTDDPRRAPIVNFSRSGNEFITEFSIYDSNLDVSSAKFQFFDNAGRPVEQAFDVDLAQPIKQSNIVKGQSFTVTQRFSGANDHPTISGVRVTVFDGESSDTAISGPVVSSSAPSFMKFRLDQGTTLYLPVVNLDSSTR